MYREIRPFSIPARFRAGPGTLEYTKDAFEGWGWLWLMRHSDTSAGLYRLPGQPCKHFVAAQLLIEGKPIIAYYRPEGD